MPDDTGAHEVTTGDELQHHFAGGGGGGGGGVGRTFDPQGSYTVRRCPMTTGGHELTTFNIVWLKEKEL